MGTELRGLSVIAIKHIAKTNNKYTAKLKTELELHKIFRVKRMTRVSLVFRYRICSIMIKVFSFQCRRSSAVGLRTSSSARGGGSTGV